MSVRSLVVNAVGYIIGLKYQQKIYMCRLKEERSEQ